MTVSATTAQQTFACNGTTVTFVCPFRVLDASEMRVFLITVASGSAVELVNGTDFSVTSVGAANAVVTAATAYSSAYQLKCVRSTAVLQPTDYRDNDPFPAESHETALDRLTHIAQETLAVASRALTLPEPEDGYELPAPAARAGLLLAFDSAGTPLLVAPSSGSASALAIDLASTTLASKNAGQIGFSALLAYGAGTVGAKLREFVSVKDFGAVGDGVTNDTAAINLALAAITAGQTLYFPAGTYLIGSASASVPLSAIPVGVNVWMDKGAWLKGTGTWATNFLFPSGRNVLRVNIDGNSLPSGGVKGTWGAGSAVAIAGNSSTGLADNIEDVTIIDSEFKNMEYGIMTDGAKGWRVSGCYFHHLKNCGLLIGAQSGKESLRCIVTENVFDDLGDYAVAFYSTNQLSPGANAWHVVANNTARNCQQVVNGYAFGVEAGDPDYQHHFVFANNVYQCTSVGLLGGNGGITISTTSDSVVIGNNLSGNLSDTSNAVGINAVGFGGKIARRSLIQGNHIERFSNSAISLHGNSDTLVTCNHIVDCGYNSSGFAPIRAGSIAASDVAITNNTIRISAGYAYYGAGTPAIGISGAALSRFTIAGNIITNPNDIGILFVGTSGSPAANVNIAGNTINGTLDATFFQREAIYCDYVNDLTAAGNVVMDAKRGIVATNCVGGTLARNEFKGSATISTLYDITGSTDLRIRDDILSAPVTTVLTPTARLAALYNNTARGCASIVTEAWGTTGSIASGATVTHGLWAAPTQVTLTPAASGVTAGVTAKGSTTFTVGHSSGAGVVFDWHAVIR